MFKKTRSTLRVYHNYHYRNMDSASHYELNRKKYKAMELVFATGVFGASAYLLIQLFL